MGTFRMLIALGWRAHQEALKELVFLTLVSTSPLLLGAMIRWIQIENEALTLDAYVKALDSFLVRGELFLYALAFIAIIAWTALKDWPLGLKPPRVILGLFCLLAFAIIVVFYCLDTTKIATHADAVLIFSRIMFVITLGFYYLTTVLGKVEAPNLVAILAESSSALSAQLDRGTEP